MAKRYIVHPGTVKLLSGSTVTYDAATLASLYGLSGADYDVATTGSEQEDVTGSDIIHIHLYPREDGQYRNIKTLQGDNGTDSHWDYEVGYKDRRAKRIREAGL